MSGLIQEIKIFICFLNGCVLKFDNWTKYIKPLCLEENFLFLTRQITLKLINPILQVPPGWEVSVGLRSARKKDDNVEKRDDKKSTEEKSAKEVSVGERAARKKDEKVEMRDG